MGLFTERLKKSNMNQDTFESALDDFDDKFDDDYTPTQPEEDVDFDIELGDSDDDGDDDLSDGLTPEEIAELRELISADSVADIVDDVEPVEELTPEQNRLATDLMCTAATTELIKQDLPMEDCKTLLENAEEVRSLVAEGFLIESQIYDICDRIDGGEEIMTEAFSNKTIVKFNKKARIQQFFGMAINVCAASAHDPEYLMYKKLRRAMKIKKARLHKKYKSPAMKLVKVWIKRMASSKSSVIQKFADKLKNK